MARKGLIALILVVCFSLTSVLPAYAAFSDVSDAKLTKIVDDLSAKNIVSGFADGTFRPDDPVTRAQMAKLVAIAKNLSSNSAAGDGTAFSDISPQHWAASYIRASHAAGIVKGYSNPDGTFLFKPNKQITRGELARMLCRASGAAPINPVNPAFKDVGTGYWAYSEIETVVYCGIMGGYHDGTFHPGLPATRAQTAIALYNMMNADLTPPAENTAAVGSDGKLVIVVDAGHGGVDPGAIAPSNGLKEKDVNLCVALKLRDLLKAAGLNCITTRSTDDSLVHPYDQVNDLAARAQVANDAKADLFVSIHHNSAGSSAAVGTAVYSYPGSAEGAKLAETIQEELVKALGWSNVPGKDDGTHTANFAVLRRTLMTAVLCESAYMSNPEEAELLATDEFRQKEAQGIYNGIAKYLNQ